MASDPKDQTDDPQAFESNPATADDLTQQNSEEWEKEHGAASKAPEDQSDQSKPDLNEEK